MVQSSARQREAAGNIKSGINWLHEIIGGQYLNLAVCGYYGYRNIGDEAILDALVSMTPKGTNLSIYSGDPDVTRRKYKNVHHIGYGFNPRWLFPPKRLRYVSDVINPLKKCEGLIVGGGGLIHDRGFYGGGLTKFSIEKIALAKRLGKKVLVIGVGAQPFKRRLPKILFTHFLNKADQIVVRDIESKDLLIEMGVNQTKVIPTIDLAVNFVKKEWDKKISDSSNTVGFAVRWNPLRGIFNSEINTAFAHKIAILADHVVKQYRKEVMFIPFQYPPIETNDQRFVDLVLSFSKYKNSMASLPCEYEPSDILRVIHEEIEFMVCMRYHSLIFSTLCRKPYVSIMYAPKVERFVKRFNLREFTFSDSDKAEKMCSRFDLAFKEQKEILNRVEKAIDEITLLNQQNCDILSTFCKSSEKLSS